MPATMGAANEVPPPALQVLGLPAQLLPPLGSELQNTRAWPQGPREENIDTSGRPRTPSLGMPTMPVCHDGLGYPWQVPVPATPGIEGVPVAHRLGPPLPPVTVQKPLLAA